MALRFLSLGGLNMVSRIPYDLYGMYFLLEGMVKLTRSIPADQLVSFAGHRSLFYQYRKYPKHL